MPYLKTLSLENKSFTFEDVFDESHYDNYDQKVLDYLSAYFYTILYLKELILQLAKMILKM